MLQKNFPARKNGSKHNYNPQWFRVCNCTIIFPFSHVNVWLTYLHIPNLIISRVINKKHALLSFCAKKVLSFHIHVCPPGHLSPLS